VTMACMFLQFVSFHVVDIISLNSTPPFFPKLFVLFDKILCFLDLSKVYNFKFCIFVCPNFWKNTFGLNYMLNNALFDFFRYEKTHILLLHMKRYIVCVSRCCNARGSKKHESWMWGHMWNECDDWMWSVCGDWM
jgi:hypothetical protein